MSVFLFLFYWSNTFSVFLGVSASNYPFDIFKLSLGTFVKEGDIYTFNSYTNYKKNEQITKKKLLYIGCIKLNNTNRNRNYIGV